MDASGSLLQRRKGEHQKNSLGVSEIKRTVEGWNGNSLPMGTIESARAMRYGKVLLKNQGILPPLLNTLSLFAALSFLATPAGVWCIFFAVNTCAAFIPIEFVVRAPLQTLCITTLVTSILSVTTFVPFARYHDGLYKNSPGLRNQPQAQTHDTDPFISRSEVQLSVFCLCIAAFVSSCVVIGKVTRGWGLMYTGVEEKGWAYLFFSVVVYFFWIDLWAYLGHRALHLPFLYRTVHKWHHVYKQPTAFSGLGLHPVDMLIIQGGVYVALYVFPMHISVIAVNLLYVHYHNVIDHSGVYSESPFPWQPSSLYHDDHHKLFHVNYGQTLTIWDRLGRTFYSPKKKYCETSYSY